MTAQRPDADPWRPQFHIAALRGLVNDPNGLIHWNGRTHVFFQINPTGCTHTNKGWAHVVSDDLVHWHRLPQALAPGDSFDSHGCYSGSAVAQGDQLVLIYTGNVRNAQDQRESYQCLARSSDGIGFEKLGPVISGPLPGYTAHFRDPKVWAQDGRWWMVLGAQTEDLQGTVLLLSSEDLHDWHLAGRLLDAGHHGYMCECPDLFALDGQDVLLFSEQRAAQGDAPTSNIAGWVAGRVDLATAAYAHGAFQRLDHGRDFYAPQTFEHADGRRIMLGWMGLPEQDSAPSVAYGWFHCLTVPRELRLVNGRLCQQPIDELTRLRGPESRFDGLQGAHTLPVQGTSYELELSGISGRFALDLRAGGAERTRLELSPGAVRLTGIDALGQATVLGQADLPPGAGQSLRILVDHSSVEVFLDAGEIVLSARIYPDASAKGIVLTAPDARVAALSFWPLASFWDADLTTGDPAFTRAEEVSQ